MHDDLNDAAGGDEQIAALRAQLASALEERNAAWGEAQKARALEVELAHTRSLIADMRRSASWRVTSPLRGSKRHVMRLRSLRRTLSRS